VGCGEGIGVAAGYFERWVLGSRNVAPKNTRHVKSMSVMTNQIPWPKIGFHVMRCHFMPRNLSHLTFRP
jgi:hypothetical protein